MSDNKHHLEFSVIGKTAGAMEKEAAAVIRKYTREPAKQRPDDEVLGDAEFSCRRVRDGGWWLAQVSVTVS